jgi:hypothetical protein
MARGWESKSVEAQQAERDQPVLKQPPVTPEEARRLDARRTLELSRARAEADPARATSPAHRAMLESALQALDVQLGAGKRPESSS